MASEAQLQLRAQRAAQRESTGYEPIRFSPPEPEKPKIFGRDIEMDDELLREKSLTGRVVNDAALLAYGVPTGLAQIGTGLVTDPVDTLKLVGGGILQTGKDILGTTGILGSDAQKQSIDYYKAHPLMGLFDAFGVASFGAGTIVKGGVVGTARSATLAASKEAAKAGVKKSVVNAALHTRRGVFDPKRWFGKDTKVATPFYNSIQKVVRTGQTQEVAEIVAKQFVKQGVSENIAVKIARAAADDVAKSIAYQSTKLRVANAIYHPVETIGQSIKGTGAKAGNVLFGKGDQTAVAKIFGSELVKNQKKTAISLERWLEAVVNEKGLENTLDNRISILMDWKKQSDFANLTPEQLFKDFDNYVKADLLVRRLRELTNNNFVPVKVISKEAADSMLSNVKSNINEIVEEIAGTMKDTDPARRTSVAFDKLNELMTQVHGRDWEKYSDMLRKAYGEKGSVKNLEKAITSLASKRPSISFKKWSKEARAIAAEMEGTGYRIDVAPTNKQVSFVSDVFDEVESNLFSEARKYKTAEEFLKAQSKPLYHGTNTKFEVFNKSKIGSATDEGLFGRGFYFGNTEAFARVAPKGRLAKIVMEVYAPNANLFDINKIKNKSEMAELLNMSKDALIKDSNGIIRPVRGQVRQFTSHLQDLGYDGVIIKRGGDAVETVIFEPSQIKTKSQLTDIWNEANKSLSSKSKILESSFDAQRTFVGRVLDKFGLSARGVVEGTNEFLYGQAFLQNALDDIANAFGNSIKVKMPIAVTTPKGVVSKTRNVTVPVSNLYEFLRNHRDEIFRERIGIKGAQAFRPISVFDITAKDLARFGFDSDVAKAIDKVSRKSLRQTPASVIGMGEKIVNLMRGSNVDFAVFGRHYDNFLKASFYMRYQSPLAFLFQAQQYLETRLMASMITKDSSFIPGAGLMANFGKRLIPKQITGRLREVRGALQDIVDEPKLHELVIARDDILPNTQRALEDVLGSPEFARERIGIERATKNIERTAQVMSRGHMEGLWMRAMGGWTMNVAAKIGKAISKKFGMTLDEATEYTMRNGVKVYKNPRLVREIQDTVQQTIHYKKGFQTSPLIRTLNIVWFPFRFQAKTLSVTAKWLGELSPTQRLVVINNWVNFANWAGTDEGIEWRRTNQNKLYSLLAYTTAWEQLGDSLDAVSRGQLFGGNTGLIGGIPFAFFYNWLQEMAVLTEDPQQIDPRTGQPFKFKETPREIVSDVAALKLIEEYVFTMLPGTPFYTISGGVVQGASFRNYMENILESGYGGIKAYWEGQDPTRGKELLERDFIRLPFDETR